MTGNMIHIFIINPSSGMTKYANDLRTRLEQIPDINYFIFNTRHAGYESELMRKITHVFDGDRIRIYCCGGSGTMRNILTALPDVGKIEIAFFPCGLTNDFLKVFGDKQILFSDIENLINGEVLDVDYLKTDHGIALNTISVGMDPVLLKYTESIKYLSFISKQVPYHLSLIRAILTCSSRDYIIKADDEEITPRTFEMVAGNGFILGGNIHFSEKANVCDGIGEFVVGYDRSSLGVIPIFYNLIRNNRPQIDKRSKKYPFSTLSIKRKDGSALYVNMDGELVKNVPELKIEVVKQGLHFVVPKGVSQ